MIDNKPKRAKASFVFDSQEAFHMIKRRNRICFNSELKRLNMIKKGTWKKIFF
jgi:hypothetical protein